MNQTVSKVREARIELYRKKGKIHARSVDGRFNRARWAMVWLTQIIFYGGVWLTWNGQGGSRQAILFDITHQKLYSPTRSSICSIWCCGRRTRCCSRSC